LRSVCRPAGALDRECESTDLFDRQPDIRCLAPQRREAGRRAANELLKPAPAEEDTQQPERLVLDSAEELGGTVALRRKLGGRARGLVARGLQALVNSRRLALEGRGIQRKIYCERIYDCRHAHSLRGCAATQSL